MRSISQQKNVATGKATQLQILKLELQLQILVANLVANLVGVQLQILKLERKKNKFVQEIIRNSFFSGGHCNPAISFSALLFGKIGILQFIIYTIAQLLGAFAGTGIAFVGHLGECFTLNQFYMDKFFGENDHFCCCFCFLILIKLRFPFRFSFFRQKD